MTSSKIQFPQVSNSYNKSEIKAISSIKINSFIQTSTFLFKLDRIATASDLKSKRILISILKQQRTQPHHLQNNSRNSSDKHQRLNTVQKRLEKLLDLPIVKKLGRLRLLNKQRAFLRWKVKTDIKLQGTCIKKFAVYARLDHTVALWRMKWIVDKSILGNQKQTGYKENLEEFLQRMEGVKREIYSKRNQLQYALIKIRQRFNFIKKVEDFDGRCKTILKEQHNKQQVFYKIRKISILKKNVVELIVHKQKDKMRKAYLQIIENYRKYLLNKASIASENIVLSSLNVLESKVTENITQCLRIDNKQQFGLEMLSKIIQNKQNLDKTLALNKLCTSVYEVGKKISDALQKLEKTARDILKSNLRKLRQNNRIRKVQVLQRLIGVIVKKQADVARAVLRAWCKKKPAGSDYKTFCFYLSELFKTKSVGSKIEGFRSLCSAGEIKLKVTYLGLQKLMMVQNKLMEQKNKGFNSLVQAVYKEEARKKKLEKLSNFLRNFLNKKQKQKAYVELCNKMQSKINRERSLKLLVEKLVLSQEKKVRDAMRRLVISYIDKMNLASVVPNLNTISGKTSFHGLEEIISIAAILKKG